MTPAPRATPVPTELVAASLLTSAEGAEVHLIATDGRRLRLPADEETARALVVNIWRALDRPS
jgi:hypothetical protein